MWFKQFQLFQLTTPVNSSASVLNEKLEPFRFSPCLPSMASSMGWVSPVEDEEHAPLTRGINGCIMICLQTEEKILPGSVVTKTLKDKIKEIELAEGRRVRQKEKLLFKDELIHTLLTQAFTKFNRLYGFIDTRHNRLIINSTSPKKIEAFIMMLKKAIGDGISSFDVVKPSAIMTQWLKTQDYPANFSIERTCVLQDPNDQHRIIRCQQQDLFADSIQTLVKDGCEAMQMGFCWQDRINFVLSEDFSLKSVSYTEDDIAEIKDELETKQQKFDADFIMMIESLTDLLNELLSIFVKQNEPATPRLAVA